MHKTFCGKNVEHKTSCTKPFWIQRPGVTTSLNPPIMLCVNPPKPFLEACRLPVCPPRPSIWYVDKWESADVEPQGVEMHVYFPIGQLGQIVSLGKSTHQSQIVFVDCPAWAKPHAKSRYICRLSSLGKATSQISDCICRLPGLGRKPQARPKKHVIAPLAGQPREPDPKHT